MFLSLFLSLVFFFFFYCLKLWFLSERPESCVSRPRALSQGQQKDQTAACGHAEEDGVPGVAGSDSLGPAFGGPGTHPVQIRGSVERALGVLSWNLFSTML